LARPIAVQEVKVALDQVADRQLDMSAYPLVDAAAKYCWGKNGAEVFKAYFDRHAPLFVVRRLLRMLLNRTFM